MTKKILIGVAAVVIIAVILLNVLYFKPKTSEPIRIGGILMLTGAGSTWGLNSQRGADLAIEEINNEGGINGRQLEIIYEDNQGDDARVAVSAFYGLLRDDIKIILGTNWSPSGIALAPLACEEEVLMISPSLGVAEFNEECDYLFNLWPHDFLLSKELGSLVYDDGYRKIAILGSQQAWEQEQAYAVKAGFENAGGEVVSFQLPSQHEEEFSDEVQNIKEANPEAVVLTLSTDPVGLAAKKLYEAGVNVQFYAILLDSGALRDAEGALEGTIAVTSFTPNQEFTDLFISKFGERPDIGFDTSYDAIKLIAESIEETGSTDPNVLKDYINSLDEYEGVSGTLKFDGKGGVIKPFKFIVVEGDMISDR